MQREPSDLEQSNDKLKEAHEELAQLRQKIKKLERDNKLLSITNANSEKLRAFHSKEKSLHYLYNDLLLKHMPNMLFIFDTNLRLVLCSQSSINFLRYTSVTDVLNQPLEKVFSGVTTPQWTEKIQNQCIDSLNMHSVFRFNDEITFENKDFAPLDAQIVVAPVIDGDNALRGVVISVSDITELTAMKEKAEAAAKMKSNFLASMSHEIRTPMNAVKGLSELLLMTQLTHIQRDYVRKIVSSSNSLLHIINDVLDFSKIEAGKIEILPAPYNLRDLINELTSIVNLRAAEKNLLFLVDIDPNLPSKLNGDEFRIKQILINLLSNAIKYTQSGFIRLTVHGEPLNEMFNLRFAVQDSGIGIKEEELPYLFDPFKRSDLHANKTITGTGLGLTITRKLTETMHGHIRVKSTYGKGSTFVLSLPQEILSHTPIAQNTATDINTVLIFTPPNRVSNITAMLEALGIKSIWSDSVDALPELVNKSTSPISHCIYLESYAPNFPDENQHLFPNCTFMVLKDIRQALDQSGVATVSFFEPLLITHLCEALNSTSYQPETHHFYCDQQNNEFLIGKKALVVDDNDINLMVAANLIESYGLTVTTTDSGQGALDICQQDVFDIIFMDHMMDGLDGIETTIKIRTEDGPNQKTPIIALTANVLQEVQQEFYACGMDDFIAKPIDISELCRVLTTWAHSPALAPAPQSSCLQKNQPSCQPSHKNGVPLPQPFTLNKNIFDENHTPKNFPQLPFNLFTLLDDFGMYASDVLRELNGSEDEYIERLVQAEKILGPLVEKLKNVEDKEQWHTFSMEILKLRDVLFDIGARDCSGRAKNLALLAQNKDKSEIHQEFTSLMGNMYMLAKKLQTLVPTLTGHDENIPINDQAFLRTHLQKLHGALTEQNLSTSLEILEILASASFNKTLDTHLNTIKKLLENNHWAKALAEAKLTQKMIF